MNLPKKTERKEQNLIQVWSVADPYTFPRRCGLAYIQVNIQASVIAMAQLYINITTLQITQKITMKLPMKNRKQVIFGIHPSWN